MTTSLATLPELDSEYEVSDAKVSYYRENGHVLLRGVASTEEAAAYVPIIGDALEEHRKERRKLEDRDTYHKAFIQVGNLWEVDEGVRRYVMAKRFAKIAADLMEVDGVRLYHDQALFKEAGGGHTPWHQDQYYWPIDSNKTITMWMALVDAPAETGAMIFASGSQREGSIVQMHISDESSEFFKNYVAERDLPLAASELVAGDATFHSGWTLHKAPGNSTSALRAAMTVIYYADGVRIAEPSNQHQPKDLERFFPGQKPGDIAKTDLNPLLYHRDPAKMAAG